MQKMAQNTNNAEKIEILKQEYQAKLADSNKI
jgi:hypothetical protein